MGRLYKPWDAPDSAFGDVAVLAFLIVQCLDGVFTYLGVSLWGAEIEANPLIRSAVETAGLATAVATAKLAAAGFGMLLHLRRVHTAVALLTALYVAAAILPWLYLFTSR
jgi:hypothetical protein